MAGGMSVKLAYIILIVVLHLLAIGLGIMTFLMADSDTVKDDTYRLWTKILTYATWGFAGGMAVFTFTLIGMGILPGKD